jgi:hypothetical protein
MGLKNKKNQSFGVDRSEKARNIGLYLTVLAAFLAAFADNQLALPSFGLAVVGTIVFGYGLLAGDN